MSKRSIVFVAICLSVFASIASAFQIKVEKLEGKPPDPFAPAHKIYAWNSKGDLRFTWWLPPNYEPKTPRNMTVILHGTGLDYRWGHLNNKPEIFRPDDIVISVDGTSKDGEARVFLGDKKDVDAFQAFLVEMRQTFAVDHIFLYGHSQGGFFVTYFAGEHPEMISGVVAHASGAWNFAKMSKDEHKVAIAFMHGTADPVVPFRQSPAARDTYEKAGFELVHLRRLENYNHWPNAVRANETLDWCQGMTTDKPEEALAIAIDILRDKKTDEYRWEAPVGYSAARDVLRRLEGKGPVPFKDVPEVTASQAKTWIANIDEAGALHVATLKKELARRKDLKLDGKPWLGHLIALREDFRGVESVEAYVKEMGFDETLATQTKAVEPVMTAWYGEKPPKAIFESVVDVLAKTFLFEGYPPDLAAKMKEWKNDAAKLGITPKVLKKYPDFEAWQAGWEDGSKQYASVWKKWKGP